MTIDWQGIFPALTTRFLTNGEIDFPSFEISLQKQMEAEVDGIILCGTLGEASTMNQDEKISLLKYAKKVAKNIPVLINVAESSTTDAIAFAKNAEAAGADGLMALPPLRYTGDDSEIVEYFHQIADCTSLPIMIYNNPVDYKIHVTIDMFKRLIEKDNIVAVKESTRITSNVLKMTTEFGDRIKVFCGVDTLALESFVLGGCGWVGGLVCAYPKETVAIYRHMKQGNYEKAVEIYRWFMPLLELDLSPKLVQNIKLCETAMKIGTEPVRLPRKILSGSERDSVLKTIAAAQESYHKIEKIVQSAYGK